MFTHRFKCKRLKVTQFTVHSIRIWIWILIFILGDGYQKAIILHLSILLHSLNDCLALLMSVNMQRCFLLVHSLSFTTCFDLMLPSLGVHPLTEPPALLWRFRIQLNTTKMAARQRRHRTHKEIHNNWWEWHMWGRATWPKNQNWMQQRHNSAAGSVKGWTPEDGRMRPKHVKGREWTSRKQRCMLKDIRKAKESFRNPYSRLTSALSLRDIQWHCSVDSSITNAVQAHVTKT
jgi:hypothetical protein